MLSHLLSSINKMFCPNYPRDTPLKDTISTKKIHQGDSAWSIHEVTLGWSLDMVNHLPNLPPRQVENVSLYLAITNPQSTRITIK